jgi:hypothetical protein
MPFSMFGIAHNASDTCECLELRREECCVYVRQRTDRLKAKGG